MAYPTLEQYQEALQHPATALSDPILGAGTIPSTGLGLPLVISGGFALTYKVKTQSRQFAVRCFHKEAKGLERRYEAISRRLAALRSPYFLDFVYQPQGVRILGKAYPLIRMEWAAGETLGEFLECNYRDGTKLGALRASLRTLALYLETNGIAHGDIQSGNLMVSPDGKRVQLIDYDGMYVPEAAQLGASELGHRNFQHPLRTSQHFDTKLDRFSFIQLDLALRALEGDAGLWTRTQSEADAVVFRANDYLEPSLSSAFDEVARVPGLERDARNFAAICKGGYTEVPTLNDYLAARNVPQQIVIIRKGGNESPNSRAAYIGPYPVLDAASFELFVRHIGQTVELIGRVVEVSQGRTKRGGKPYVFVNFGDWRGQNVRLSIWSEALAKLVERPDASWVGRWVSVKGMVDPIYANRRLKYESTGITISTAHQIQSITEAEAKYRMGVRQKGGDRLQSNTGRDVPSANSATLAKILGTNPVHAPQPPVGAKVSASSPNQQLLDQMRASATGSNASTHSHRSASVTSSRPRTSNSSSPTSIGGHGSQTHRPQPGQGPSKRGWPWWIWLIVAAVVLMVMKRH